MLVMLTVPIAGYVRGLPERPCRRSRWVQYWLCSIPMYPFKFVLLLYIARSSDISFHMLNVNLTTWIACSVYYRFAYCSHA
jgi:hypothetical protein